jgi:hypothetical protein
MAPSASKERDCEAGVVSVEEALVCLHEWRWRLERYDGRRADGFFRPPLCVTHDLHDDALLFQTE